MTDKIVIVGGGTGGTILANRLSDELGTEIDAGDISVTLVTDNPTHLYKPNLLYVAFGRRELDDGRRPVADLLNRRVTLRIQRITDIDAEGKQLLCKDGEKRIRYDHLVLATGATLTPEAISGLVEGGHHFYTPEGAMALRDELATFSEGRLVLSVASLPHMCPAAPMEFVLIADDWFRKRGLRDEIEITYTYPTDRAHAIASIADWVTPLFEERDIDYRVGFEPTEVDPDTEIVSGSDGEEITYDLLVTLPPHRGNDLIAAAGLGEDGWVTVDEHTLKAEEADDLYAFGDTAALPTSKAGSAAHYQAGVLARRLATKARGQVPTATYDGKTLCFIETGLDEATFMEFGYDDQPSPPDPSRFLHWGKMSYNESYWLTARGLL